MTTASPAGEQLLQTTEEHSFPLRKAMAAGALMLSCGGAAGAAIGAAEGALTPTEIQVGPHRATAQLTFDNHLTIDLGPIGYATRATHWAMGTGVRVVAKEIPSPLDEPATETAAAVANEYIELSANPAHVNQAATDTVVTRIWHDALAGGLIGGFIGGGLSEPNRRRRQQRDKKFNDDVETILESNISTDRKRSLVQSLSPDRVPRNRKILAIGSALLLTACAGDHPIPNNDTAYVDHELDGTPAQGFAIHGELLRLGVDTVAPKVFTFIGGIRQYYSGIRKNLSNTFKNKFGENPIDSNLDYVLSLSDEHCNIGMDDVHGDVARDFKVALTVDSGDMTMSGLAAEEECIAAEADAIEGPKAAVMGNHDSPTIAQSARKHGMFVVDNNQITQVGKFKLMGSADVNESTFGTGIHLRGSETVNDEAEKLKIAACAKQPDIILQHEPEEAMPAIVAGCAPLAITGHVHNWHKPKVLNTTTGSMLFIEGTSGGAKQNTPTVTTLGKEATDTVFGFDRKTHRAVGYYLLKFQPDGAVSISDFIATPQVAPTYNTPLAAGHPGH